jgi:hypothetical protein
VLEKLLLFIAKFLPYREIIRYDGDLYLTRYKFLGFMPNKKSWLPFSLYLHQFHRPDADEAPHNHPWKWSCSLILVGGYWEYRISANTPARTKWKGPFTLNWIPHGVYHMVTKMRFRKTWTLFLAGPRVSDWGFLVPNRGHVDWRTYLSEQGIPVPY